MIPDTLLAPGADFTSREPVTHWSGPPLQPLHGADLSPRLVKLSFANDAAQIEQAVLSGHFDTVLCWYNCAMKEPEATVFPAAQTHNTGVVIMNASRNERLLKGPDAPTPVQFYRYVLNHDAVATTVMGLRNGDLFEEVGAGLCERVTLSREEQYALETYGAERRAAGALE